MKNITLGLLSVLALASILSLLILAVATGDVTYLLVESAIVHFIILAAIFAAFEGGRKDG